MRYTTFEFENFRGVEKTSIDLSKKPDSHINALVGLNESGKTTVLEAIHHFLSNPNLLKRVPISSGRTERDYQKMLPIKVRHYFSGDIIIKAGVLIEEEDKLKIEEFIKKEFDFKQVKFGDRFSITHKINFKDSKKLKTKNVWSLQFSGKRFRGKNFVFLKDSDWLKCADFVEKLLPKIVYFPSVLLDFPNRIVLENSPSTEEEDDEIFFPEPKNEFYCEVIDDLLKSINSELTINTHLIGRFRSGRQIDKQNLEALLIQMGKSLKQTILSEWTKIFEQAPEYDFVINLSEDNKQLGLEIKILTDEGVFLINERSAGFRWFFAYIMLTRYRLNRQDRVLFLFDEPAANLHPNAQTQLIKSFEILAKSADIIYTTHSHYLINPKWLESTHIVQNLATDKSINLFENDPTKNSIKVTPYRQFVGSHPEQYYYYKPIQEALDYAPSPLEFPSSVILVEGKTDFFTIKYFSSLLQEKNFKKWPKIFPGGGAGTLDPLISLLYGWGKDFVILVDSDEAGKTQKDRYIKKFERIVEDSVFSLEDINPKWKGCRIEELIEVADIETLRLNNFPDNTKLQKKQLHIAIQENIMNNVQLQISSATLDNFSTLLDFLDSKLVIKSIV